MTPKLTVVSGWVENFVRKGRKWWLPAFSPFPTMFSKFFFLGIINTRDYAVKRVHTKGSNPRQTHRCLFHTGLSIIKGKKCKKLSPTCLTGFF